MTNQHLLPSVPVLLKRYYQCVNVGRATLDSLMKPFMRRKTSGEVVCLPNV